MNPKDNFERTDGWMYSSNSWLVEQIGVTSICKAYRDSLASMLSSMNTQSGISGYKYLDLPGTLHYTEAGGCDHYFLLHWTVLITFSPICTHSYLFHQPVQVFPLEHYRFTPISTINRSTRRKPTSATGKYRRYFNLHTSGGVNFQICCSRFFALALNSSTAGQQYL